MSQSSEGWFELMCHPSWISMTTATRACEPGATVSCSDLTVTDTRPALNDCAPSWSAANRNSGVSK